MAISIEQFTAPGKYYINKKFEEINRQVNTPLEIKNPQYLKGNKSNQINKTNKYNNTKNK